jgi:hypothetical protein
MLLSTAASRSPALHQLFLDNRNVRRDVILTEGLRRREPVGTARQKVALVPPSHGVSFCPPTFITILEQRFQVFGAGQLSPVEQARVPHLMEGSYCSQGTAPSRRSRRDRRCPHSEAAGGGRRREISETRVPLGVQSVILTITLDEVTQLPRSSSIQQLARLHAPALLHLVS